MATTIGDRGPGSTQRSKRTLRRNGLERDAKDTTVVTCGLWTDARPLLQRREPPPSEEEALAEMRPRPDGRRLLLFLSRARATAPCGAGEACYKRRFSTVGDPSLGVFRAATRRTPHRPHHGLEVRLADDGARLLGA